MPFVLCSDFSVFPYDTQRRTCFHAFGDGLQGHPRSAVLFREPHEAELGLQFPDQGLDVSLSTIVSGGRFRVGQFNSPLTAAPRGHTLILNRIS